MEPEALLLLELGAVVLARGILARAAGRLKIPPIPLYLLAGLAFGRGGLVPLVTAEEFIEVGADMGLILLLFMLGLEYSAEELRQGISRTAPAAGLDLTLNFLPGMAAGLLLGWGPLAAAFLGGIVYISSSGVVSKLLHDFGRLGHRETPVILSLLVAEDLAMAIYLPVMAGLLAGGLSLTGLISVLAAVAGVLAILALALRIEVGLSRLIFSHSDEALLLSILGMTLLAAGVAESLRISAAVGALLAGIVVSGPAARGARGLLAPLRDLFAALFFAFFGLSIDPSSMPPVLWAAAALAAVTAGTKFATGWLSGGLAGVGRRGRIRAGAILIARGEFSIAIAGLAAAAGIEPELAPMAAAYVLILAVAGPLAVRATEPAARIGGPRAESSPS